MNKAIIIFFVCILIYSTGNSFAQSQKPPFSTVTIHGKTDKKFNRVSLFKSGSSTKPYKTKNIGSGGSYSISILIPKDMIKKEGYYVTDMRFWTDDNNNSIKDENEPRSQCHFIMWHPEYKKVVMKIYQGDTYEITRSQHNYNWQ